MSATAQRRKRFRVLRATEGLTQRQVAKKARMTMERYWKIENGWAEPTEDELARLARAFKCEPGDVLGPASSEAVA